MVKKSQRSEIKAPQLRQPCVNRAKSHTSRTLGIYWDRIQMSSKKKAKLSPAINPQKLYQNWLHTGAGDFSRHSGELKAIWPLCKRFCRRIQNFWEKGFLTHRTHHLNLENVHGHKMFLRMTL
jgi:hypothetical protein